MKHPFYIFFISLILASCIRSQVIDNSQSDEGKNEVENKKAWRTLIEFSGHSDKQSDFFEVSGQLKVHYCITPTPSDPDWTLFNCYFLPKSKKISLSPTSDAVINTMSFGKDSTFINLDPGIYYLDVTCTSDWSLIVYERN